jgi:tmRNA-binding protein
MKIYKTHYESLYRASPPSRPAILIELDFLDGWEIKIFQDSVREIFIAINLKNIYVPQFSISFLQKNSVLYSAIFRGKILEIEKEEVKER